MHCSGAWWSVCLPQWRTPCTSCSLRLCIQRMQVLGCHTARLSDLCCHRGCRSPTPWAALDATTINEISHADRAWAATAPREIKKKTCVMSEESTWEALHKQENWDKTTAAHDQNPSNSAKTSRWQTESQVWLRVLHEICSTNHEDYMSLTVSTFFTWWKTFI